MTAAPFTVNQDIRYLVPHDEILPAFLLRTLQNEARSILFAVRESTHGTRRLESPTLKLWPIPIPPVDEQQEVICRVDALFDLADTIEKQVESATKRAEKITQAILAKAFRGELIPTEAELARRESRSYEPASALLERIKSEHKKKPVDTSGDTLPHRRRAPNSRGNPRSASG
jgi:type I restriction enzyme S subunit